MIHQNYPFFKNFKVKGFYLVPRLVVIHCNAGREHDCRDSVVNEYPLVRKSIEHPGETAAAVICQVDVHVDGEHSVADMQQIPLDGLERMGTEHYDVVFSFGFQRRQSAADLVYIDHEADFFFCDEFP